MIAAVMMKLPNTLQVFDRVNIHKPCCSEWMFNTTNMCALYGMDGRIGEGKVWEKVSKAVTGIFLMFETLKVIEEKVLIYFNLKDEDVHSSIRMLIYDIIRRMTEEYFLLWRSWADQKQIIGMVGFSWINHLIIVYLMYMYMYLIYCYSFLYSYEAKLMQHIHVYMFDKIIDLCKIYSR